MQQLPRVTGLQEPLELSLILIITWNSRQEGGKPGSALLLIQDLPEGYENILTEALGVKGAFW